LRAVALGATVLYSIFLSNAAHAAGTPAGTVLDSVAQLTYEIGGNPVSLSSNTVSVIVAERIDVVVTLQSPQVLVAGGDTNRNLLLRVSNTGNGDETFLLTIDSNLAGDDFDPVPATPAIYFDTDGSGDLNAGDVAYAPGTNDPLLAADGFVDVLLVNDIPLAVANGQTGLSALTASAATGTGNPGDVYAGQGDSGVDAVLGTTGGLAQDSGEYLVSDVAVSIAKTVVVTDPFGGTEPVPGATLTYSIAVQVNSAGTASNSTVNDPVPANTSFVPSSISLNGSALSDAIDGDAGELDTSAVPSIVVRLGNLTQASGIQTVSFQVTID
jgi:uncharacterized repeat protein (TIGR01451 family)